MVPNIMIKCDLCGKDIPVDSPRFLIGNDDICEYCASSMTLEEIFNAEKVKGISFFDGKLWNNPFIGPSCETDCMKGIVADIPATEYQRYCAEWEKMWNPNNMTDEEYQHWKEKINSMPALLTEEEFTRRGYNKGGWMAEVHPE